MHSKNLADEKYEVLKDLFPSAITETINEDGEVVRAIDKDVLMQEISTQVIEGREERYQFTWPDKKKTILNANAPINKTLRPAREESVNFDETENLYIEGDNLEVLKLLQETYLGKIKMIYIDPPYNTGNDFVYNDDFKESVDEYLENSGQFDEDGNRLEKNLESNGRYHTDWLNMMYPRLKLARNLLTEDGTVLISIDDNEVDNLIKICEEIFGQNNVEIAIWNKEAEGASGTLKQISTFRGIHEYIIFAYKNKEITQFNKINEALKGREDEFQTANLAVNKKNERKNHVNYFTIINPSGDKFTKQWKWSKEKIDKLISEDLIYWGSDGHKQPRLIIPTDERRTTFLLSILSYGGTTVGRKDFEALMGEKIEFSYPKPIILLKKLIDSVTDDEDIVLDFFSGSGSTAQAIIELNIEKLSNRKFVIIQLPEETGEKSEAYKAGYKTIAEIGKERIRRAGKQILEENKDKEGIENLDIGFRVLKTDSSNMKDVYYSPADTEQNFLDDLEDNIKEDRTPEDLLFQIMLDLGVSLSSKIESQTITGKEVFVVEDGFLISCFDKDISDDTVKEIAKKEPYYAVFRDRSMANDSVAANFDQIFASLSPETIRKVI